jgi:ferrochelatase
LIFFSAHSIPLVDAARSNYVEQLQWTCRAVIEKSCTPFPWELVYQSRSGPAEHWLGPDIMERIDELAMAGQVESVIVSPLGFFCENMETEYDLDVEIGEYCAIRGINFCRSKTVGVTPKICRLITEMMK